MQLAQASVITQYHTSVMFAPNVVGTANAAAAGWGNAGGGATQAIMPLILGAIVMFGVEQAMGWRIALLVPWCNDADRWRIILEIHTRLPSR